MYKKRNVLHQVIFWGMVVLAVTAEGWMDLICRALY